MDSADSIDDDQDRSYIDLQYLMPDAPGVHIIITSRSSTVKGMTALKAIEVANMEFSEAAELFRQYAKIQDPGADVTTEVNQIVKELECLALSITLAGSYVSVTPRLSSDIKRYLPEYRQRRKKLLRRRPQKQVHRYGESVLSTWEASFDAIAMESSAATRLLGVLAFMNFDDIFLQIFDRNVDGIDQQSDAVLSSAQTWRSFLFSEGEWSLYQLESAMEVLQRYAFVQWRVDQHSYSMHKLVHAWGQDRLDTDTQRQYNDVTLELLAGATANNKLNSSYKLRLVPHLMANFGTSLERRDWIRETATNKLALINRVEDFLYAIGRWSEAYEVQAFVVKETEKMLGKEHPSTLTSMNNLASALERQGKYDEAVRIHRQTLALRETVLSKEHPDTLASMNNLAFTWKEQGQNPKAISLMGECVHLRTRILGAKHLDTLSSSAAFTEWQIQGPEISSSATNKMTIIEEEPKRLDEVSDYAIHSGPRKKGFLTTLWQKVRS